MISYIGALTGCVSMAILIIIAYCIYKKKNCEEVNKSTILQICKFCGAMFVMMVIIVTAVKAIDLFNNLHTYIKK